MLRASLTLDKPVFEPLPQEAVAAPNPFKAFTDEWGDTLAMWSTILSGIITAYTLYLIVSRGRKPI